jgi:hypothetical protein
MHVQPNAHIFRPNSFASMFKDYLHIFNTVASFFDALTTEHNFSTQKTLLNSRHTGGD